MPSTPDKFEAVPFPAEAWSPELRALSAVKPVYLPPGWVSTLEQELKRKLAPLDPKGIQADCEAVFKAKSERDADRIKEIQDQAPSANSAAALVQKVVGGLDAPLSHPATAAMIKAAFFDMQPVVFYFKMLFNRGRPWMCCDLDIDPMFPRPHPWYPGHPAYPSGHSTQAYTVARLYARMFRKLETKLDEAAQRVARNREVAGLHFPTDTEAGRILAEAYVDLLLAQPAFKDMFEIAKAEWPELA